MDFNFSSQHHATIHSESGSTVILTLLDNAADDKERQPNTAKTSSAKMVELDTETMTAKVRPHCRTQHASRPSTYPLPASE
jgi:hypothetical protein